MCNIRDCVLNWLLINCCLSISRSISYSLSIFKNRKYSHKKMRRSNVKFNAKHFKTDGKFDAVRSTTAASI